MSDKIPYMTKKRLASGRVAYYFNLPKHRRPAGWKSSTPLGDDYLDAVKKAVHLNEQLKALKKEKKKQTARNSLRDIYEKYTRDDNRFYTDLAPRTKKSYHYSFQVLAGLKNGKGETFDNIDLSEMNFKAAEQLYFNLLEKRKINVARQCMVFLRLIYNWAVKYEYYDPPNPFDKMRIKSYIPKKRIITDDQLKALLRAARQLNLPQVRLAIHINYWICQRPNDVLSLKRENFYIKNGVGFFKIRQHKTGVEVSPALPPILSKLIDRMGAGFIIKDQNAEGYSVVRFSKAFKKVKEEAGLKDVCFKDLRHTGTTAYVDAGVGSTQVIAITGHTTEGIMNRVYRRNTEKQSEEALKKRMFRSDSKK